MMNWAYVAGFFDGEGCVRQYQPGLCVQIVQCGDRGIKVLTEISDWMEQQGIRSKIRSRPPARSERLERHTLELADRLSKQYFLESVLPYLHVKKLEAQDTARYLKVFPPTNAWKKRFSGILDKVRERREQRSSRRSITGY